MLTACFRTADLPLLSRPSRRHKAWDKNTLHKNRSIRRLSGLILLGDAALELRASLIGDGLRFVLPAYGSEKARSFAARMQLEPAKEVLPLAKKKCFFPFKEIRFICLSFLRK